MIATETNRYSTNISRISCQTGELGTDSHPWEQRQLGDIADLIGGNAWRSKDYSTDGKYLVVTIANVSGAPYINEMGNKINIVKKSPFILSKDDILVSLTGNVGRVSKMSDIPAVLNQRVGKIIPKARTTDRDFLFSLLHNSHFETAMIEAGQGAAQKNISNWDVLNYELCIPLESREQTQIGNFFSNLDSLIAAAERQEDLLKQKKQAYLQLMFPQEGETQPRLRFSGFSGDWEQRQLGEVVSERNERSASGELLSISMSRGVYPTSYSDRKDNSSEDKSNYKHLAVGDIAYNSMRMWQGACGLSSFDGIISPAYTVVIPSAATDGRFLVDLFKTTEMLNTFQRNSQGLTSDTWNLKYPAFSKIKCSIPSLREQRLIGRFFSTLDSLIAAAEKRAASLRALKSAYLQRMFV